MEGMSVFCDSGELRRYSWFFIMFNVTAGFFPVLVGTDAIISLEGYDYMWLSYSLTSIIDVLPN